MGWLSDNALRLQQGNYPLRFEWSPRWSDVEEGVVSPAGMAQFIEDTRATMMKRALGPENFSNGTWRGVVATIVIETLAPARYGRPLVCTGGFDHIGRSSYGHALAYFQDGVCVALSHCTGVNFGPGGAPSPLTADMRHILQQHQWAAPEFVAPLVAAPERLRPERYAFQQMWDTRISDTDMNGHVNNVALARYLDNALMAFCSACDPASVAPGAPYRWSVRNSSVALRAESFYPAALLATVAVTRMAEQGLELAQALFQEGRCVASADTVIELQDRAGRPVSLSPTLRKGLSKALWNPDEQGCLQWSLRDE